jgi:hypothetical protein
VCLCVRVRARKRERVQWTLRSRRYFQASLRERERERVKSSTIALYLGQARVLLHKYTRVCDPSMCPFLRVRGYVCMPERARGREREEREREREKRERERERERERAIKRGTTRRANSAYKGLFSQAYGLNDKKNLACSPIRLSFQHRLFEKL